MKKYWVLLILSIVVSCKSDLPTPNEIVSLEPVSSGEIVKHTYYTLAYSEENEQALWVYYTLTMENINGTQKELMTSEQTHWSPPDQPHLTIINIQGITEGIFARQQI